VQGIQLLRRKDHGAQRRASQAADRSSAGVFAGWLVATDCRFTLLNFTTPIGNADREALLLGVPRAEADQRGARQGSLGAQEVFLPRRPSSFPDVRLRHSWSRARTHTKQEPFDA